MLEIAKPAAPAAATIATGPGRGGRAYGIVFLLFVFQMLNFFDKLVLGLSAVPMMHDLHISPRQFGLIGSSFYLLFSVSGVLVGLFLIGRTKVKWILAALALIWSVAQISVYFTNSFLLIVLCRVMLGLGEGPGLPTALHACYDWFPTARRNVPSSFILQGISFGLLAGGPLLTAMILHRGWHVAFLVCGLLSLAWAAVWLLCGREGPLAAENQRQVERRRADRSEPGLPWRNPTVIGVLVMSTMSYWVVGMAGTWLPPYLRQGLGYSAARTGWIISAVYLFQSPLLLGGAWLSQHGLRSGWTRRISLGWASGFALLVSAATLYLATQLGGVLQLCLIAVAFTAPALTSVFGPVALGAIAGPLQRGRLLVIIYSANTVSALVSNAAVGWLVGRQANNLPLGYAHAMELSAAVLLLGAVAAFTLMFPGGADEQESGSLVSASSH